MNRTEQASTILSAGSSKFKDINVKQQSRLVTTILHFQVQRLIR